MSVAQAQREISSREFAEWFALDKLVEPFGDIRGDLQAGVVASVAANCMGAKTKPSDFVLKFGEDAEEKPVNMQAMVSAALRMSGAEVVQA